MTKEPKSILIVDDSDTMLESLGNILRGEGYENILFAKSAEEAFEILGLDSKGAKLREIDIILMDIVMPGMDGIEACRLIKESPHFKDVPVVMVTKRSEVEILEKAYECGAMDYVVKPANETELLARVRCFLKLKKEIDARKLREAELLDVTIKLKKANNTLQKLSYIDALTDIGNRRYFDELYSKEWRRARRENCHIALALIDIDYFKNFNDLYGHQVGDECLTKVSQAISDSLKRPVDFVARYGGEEFAVVLPQTDIKGIKCVMNNIMQAVQNLNIRHEGSETANHVTVSIGLASAVPDDRLHPASLIAEADRALYKAKEEGRNRVVSAEDLVVAENI